MCIVSFRLLITGSENLTLKHQLLQSIALSPDTKQQDVERCTCGAAHASYYAVRRAASIWRSSSCSWPYTEKLLVLARLIKIWIDITNEFLRNISAIINPSNRPPLDPTSSPPSIQPPIAVEALQAGGELAFWMWQIPPNPAHPDWPW